MNRLPAAVVFGLILTAGLISQTVSGSPTVLLSVSGGVFLVALFAGNLAVALPIATAAGLVTFAFALQNYVPWIGVAEALFLIAWSGSARVHSPIPAALAAGFFGALVLAYEIWLGWSGDMLSPAVRPAVGIAVAVSGILLLTPSRQGLSVPAYRVFSRGRADGRIPFFRVSVSVFFAVGGVVLTVFLASPLTTFAAHLREFLGGPPVESVTVGTAESTGPGSRVSSNSGRTLPSRADVTLSHDFEMLIRVDVSADAERLADGQIYCRTFVFDRYVGDRWLPPEFNEWFEDPEDGRIDGEIRFDPVKTLAPPVRPEMPHTVYVPVSREILLPTLQGVQAFQLPRIIRIGDSTFGHPSRLESGLSYRAVSVTHRVEDLPRELIVRDQGNTGELMKVPNDSTGIRISQLVETLAPRGTPLPDAIDAIRKFLWENTTYSTVIENPQNLPPLENFLFGERRGYCEFYATGGALLLRAAGFPARVGFGFSGGERTADPLAFAFFTDDGHAWTEVKVEGYGWCIADFTAPGQGAANPPAPAGPQSPTIDEDSFTSLNQLDLDAGAGWETGLSDFGWDWGGSFGILATAAGILFIAGIFPVLLRKKPTGAGTGRSHVGRVPPPPREPDFYRSFCEAAAKVGFPKLPGQTPKEHLAAIAISDPLQSSKFSELIDYYYAVRYEGASPDRARERAHRNAAGELLRSDG